MTDSKYGKYIVPKKANSYGDFEKKTEVQVFSFNAHDEAPHYFESFLMQEDMPTVAGNGNEMLYNPEDTWLGKVTKYTGLKYFAYPHIHPFTEIFYFISLDPDNPDSLGGEIDLWIGEGAEAEKYTLTKPTVIHMESNIKHLPIRHHGGKMPFLQLIVANTKEYSRVSSHRNPQYPNGIDFVENSPRWKPEPLTPEQEAKRDFAHLVHELDPKKDFLRPPRAHKGKSRTVMHYTWMNHPDIRQRVDVTLVTGGDIAFGNGDFDIFPPLPNKSSVPATLSFLSLDPHTDDLGATVELWMGEGAEAEKHIITKTTTVIIPPATVAYPIYVRDDFRHPFLISWILEAPLFGGKLIEEFPPDFEHVSEKWIKMKAKEREEMLNQAAE